MKRRDSDDRFLAFALYVSGFVVTLVLACALVSAVLDDRDKRTCRNSGGRILWEAREWHCARPEATP